MESEIDELTKELKDRFEHAFNIKDKILDSKDFFIAFCECLLFISDTPLLNRRARKVFNTTSSIFISPVRDLYKNLDTITITPEMMWNEAVRSSGGIKSKYNISLIFSNAEDARRSARMFYNHLLSSLKNVDDNPFGKIRIVINEAEHQIYLKKDSKLCYSVRSLQKDKTKSPKRFEMITILSKQKSGVSARRICALLGKTFSIENTTNIKHEIDEINSNFKNYLKVDDDLILKYMQGNKNIYKLNRKIFHFDTQLN